MPTPTSLCPPTLSQSAAQQLHLMPWAILTAHAQSQRRQSGARQRQLSELYRMMHRIAMIRLLKWQLFIAHSRAMRACRHLGGLLLMAACQPQHSMLLAGI